jgi:predicted Fe-Mo cluster-binding NifX family protein
MITAFATDDGKTFTNEHFGDAKMFLIYDLKPEGSTFLKTVENTTEPEQEDEHEHHHGDPKKAKGIGQLMKQHGVQVLVGKAFGPNIVRMNPQFVVVLMNDPTIEQAIKRLEQNYDLLVERWNQGPERKHLNLKIK